MPTIVSPTSSTTWKGSANIIWNKRVFWCSYLWNYFYSPIILKPRSLHHLSFPHLPFTAWPLTGLTHLYISTTLDLLPCQFSLPPLRPITPLCCPPAPHHYFPTDPCFSRQVTVIFTFMSLFMSSPLHSCFLPTCPLLYLIKYYLLLVPTSSAVTKLRMEQVLEKGFSFPLQDSPWELFPVLASPNLETAWIVLASRVRGQYYRKKGSQGYKDCLNYSQPLGMRAGTGFSS